ncbi:VPLPA-CTERM sorting domain-containing protein [Rubellimicrobium roseum]|uniref:VPLPA-CTERM sorting domain-containing protein n=1 Tax=Rubellimicrobium roseum TaxID=687525 RepID=A0A5C4NEJ2_9RHOB|nr:VPLPA-CTERM sorting domain-containing protein [Rubellimicrobium roseum]TNC71778.1 VPLPA-CTERM sorting domain-containing protein [Rubellimicrobium roseum]
MKARALAAAALLALMSSAASAATLSFADFVTTNKANPSSPAASVTVDDDTDGVLTFSISSTGVPALLRGIFFDVGDVAVGLGDILNPSVKIRNFVNASGNVAGGIDLGGSFTNGLTDPSFDFGLRISGTDVATSPFTFQVSSSLLALSDLERVGLRFAIPDPAKPHASRLIGYADQQPAPIPLPAGGALLITALGGLALMNRRSRKA